MGKPDQANTWLSSAEYIGCEKTTRGSEPSQYPEEQKAIAIPPVAASEQGTAQTFDMSSLPALYRGCCRAGLHAVAAAWGSKKPIS